MSQQLHRCVLLFVKTVQVNRKRSFEFNSSELMWCIQTTQIIHNNLYFSCFYIFTELCELCQYITICIVSQRSWYNRIITHVSWCVWWCVSYRVLPMSRPKQSDQWWHKSRMFRCSVVLMQVCILTALAGQQVGAVCVCVCVCVACEH